MIHPIIMVKIFIISIVISQVNIHQKELHLKSLLEGNISKGQIIINDFIRDNQENQVLGLILTKYERCYDKIKHKNCYITSIKTKDYNSNNFNLIFHPQTLANYKYDIMLGSNEYKLMINNTKYYTYGILNDDRIIVDYISDDLNDIIEYIRN